MIYAQVNKTTLKVEMFIGVQYPEMLISQQEQFPDSFFVQTDCFGSPLQFTYDAESNTIRKVKE